MANTKKTTNKNNTLTTESKIEVKETVKEERIEVKPAVVKTFNNTDEIECESIVSGEMILTGVKTENLYHWAGRGEVIGVEYQDLVAAIRMNKKYITEPFLIIRDKDFLKKYPQVDEVYKNMYSISDLQDVLTKTTADTMINTIKTLPHGAQESIKNIAATMIGNGRIDSVK